VGVAASFFLSGKWAFERPSGDHGKTTRKTIFPTGGLYEDHGKTIWKDCFTAAGLRKDHEKTIWRVILQPVVFMRTRKRPPKNLSYGSGLYEGRRKAT